MILVTGATGNIGREVVKQAAAVGVRVRALVRDAKKAAPLKGRNVELFEGSFDDPASLDAALRGAEKVFLLTPSDPGLVETQGRLLEAARRARVQHVVKLSALGASLGSPVSLGRWHAQAEKAIFDSGVPYTILRPNYFMQNVLDFAPSIMATGTFYAPMKDARVSAVDVRDIASVAVAVLTGIEHEGLTYDITGPEALSFSDMAARIGAATHQPVNYVDVAPPKAKEHLRAARLPEWLVEALLAIYAEFVAGHGAAVSTVVEELTGYPARGFDEFAREHVMAFRGN